MSPKSRKSTEFTTLQGTKDAVATPINPERITGVGYQDDDMVKPTVERITQR